MAGGFLRVNRGKDDHENLNTKGMEFSPYVWSREKRSEADDESMIYSPVHELVSCIASIAAGYEIEEILREGGARRKCSDLNPSRVLLQSDDRPGLHPFIF